MRDDRGASEVLSAILMVAVVVIAVSLVGALILNGITNDVPDTPVAGFDATITDTNTTITHLGGDSSPLTNLRLVLRTQTTREDYALTTANLSDTSNNRFDPGERWTRTHTLSAQSGGYLEAQLVHDPSNEVLVTRRLTET